MEDATPLTRRELRARAASPARDDRSTPAEPTGDTAEVETPPSPDEHAEAAKPSRLNEPSPLPVSPLVAEALTKPVTDRTALAWVDPDALSPEPRPQTSGFELLPPLRARRRFDARVVVFPAIAVVAVAVVYVAAMLLWPLGAVAPTVTDAQVTPLTGASAELEWPEEGTGAVSVSGFTPAASTTDPDQLASITKLVTALVILDELPLEPGEPGPQYEFTFADRSEYWDYIAGNQSALNVPDGGSLTQYEILQGILIASASNYADRLATETFGSVEEYTTAANAWLDENGLGEITVTDASGFDRGNEATPAAMIALAERALAHPVIAQIVATEDAELPGAGTIENTNELLGEDGVIGVKTGSYAGNYNLLAARTATVNGQELTVFAAVTGQPTDDLRVSEADRLLDAATAGLDATATLAAGTVVANVTTAWGAQTELVTDADATLLLWNGATAEPEADYALGDDRSAGDKAGTLTLTGPAGTAEVGVDLASDLPGPGAWWRLTHPLDLLGITG